MTIMSSGTKGKDEKLYEQYGIVSEKHRLKILGSLSGVEGIDRFPDAGFLSV